MAQSSNVTAGSDATAAQYNNLRADVFSAHHQDPAGVKIVNADINDAAAIALSKLAALTASRALVTDGSGIITVSAVTAAEIGYLSGIASKPVANSGDETVNGIKTFGSIPVLPASDPTTDNQATRKAYVDSFGLINIASGSFSVLGLNGTPPQESFNLVIGFVPKVLLLFWDDTGDNCRGRGQATGTGARSCQYHNPSAYGTGVNTNYIYYGKDSVDGSGYATVYAWGTTITLKVYNDSSWGGPSISCFWIALA